MSIVIHPRSEVFGAELPRNKDGTLRPILAPDRLGLTIHYVGSGSFLDLDDTPAEIRAIHAYSVSPKKGTPWEYGWVVDGRGEIWTYAGEYMAAHSAGENLTHIGVLLLLGSTEAPTDAMVLSVRKLRWWLASRGMLRQGHEVRPHRAMPGANTSCPGDRAMARWTELTAPWSPPTVAPPTITPPIVIPPSPPTEDQMLAIYRPTFTPPAGYDPAWFVVFSSGMVRRATNPDVKLAERLDIPTLDLDSIEHYGELLQQSGSAYQPLPA